MLQDHICFCCCQALFRRALEDDDDVVKMVREALAIHPGVLANSAPREDSEGRYGEGLGQGTTPTPRVRASATPCLLPGHPWRLSLNKDHQLEF